MEHGDLLPWSALQAGFELDGARITLIGQRFPVHLGRAGRLLAASAERGAPAARAVRPAGSPTA